jgi:hypothetical protein
MFSRRVPIDPAFASTTASTFYVCPAGMKAEVTQLSAKNVDTADAYRVMVYRAPSGQTAAGQFEIANPNLGPRRSDIIYEALNAVLEGGDMIWTQCDTASKVTVSGSVREFEE